MPEVMNIHQASAYLGLSKDTLYGLAGRREIPSFKLGNRWRFKRSLIDRWMEQLSREEKAN